MPPRKKPDFKKKTRPSRPQGLQAEGGQADAVDKPIVIDALDEQEFDFDGRLKAGPRRGPPKKTEKEKRAELLAKWKENLPSEEQMGAWEKGPISPSSPRRPPSVSCCRAWEKWLIEGITLLGTKFVYLAHKSEQGEGLGWHLVISRWSPAHPAIASEGADLEGALSAPEPPVARPGRSERPDESHGDGGLGDDDMVVADDQDIGRLGEGAAVITAWWVGATDWVGVAVLVRVDHAESPIRGLAGTGVGGRVLARGEVRSRFGAHLQARSHARLVSGTGGYNRGKRPLGRWGRGVVAAAGRGSSREARGRRQRDAGGGGGRGDRMYSF